MQLFSNAAGRLRRALMLAGVLLALAPAARAQEQIGVNVPFLVKDINTTAGERMSSSPRNYVVIGSTAYFVATDPAWGSELWRSDGTPAGTSMVKDINPGAGSSNINGLTNVNGTLYFSADDGIHGAELWKSNGTAAGTLMVKNIWPGNGNGFYGRILTSFNGYVYFGASDGVTGYEIWRTNGTEAGTTLVKDINPGIQSSYPQNMVIMNGALYFVAEEWTQWKIQQKLFKSNGTAAGTVMVKELNSVNYPLMTAGGKLYMIATDSRGFNQLWRSDGTAAGTVSIKDLPTGSFYIYSNVDPSVSLNGALYFTLYTQSANSEAHKELWKTDGTMAGTVLVKSFKPDVYMDYSSADKLVGAGQAFYFVANDGVTGTELWRSDGTAAGTRLVKDLWPGPMGFAPVNLQTDGKKVYFAADDGVHGRQLWRSDGTAAGTQRLSEAIVVISPGYSETSTAAPVLPDGTVFFTGVDAIHGSEPWKSSGTPASAKIVKEIGDGSDAVLGHLTAQGGPLFFSANDTNHGQELWRSDASPAGTTLVKDICPGRISGMSPEDKSIFFGTLNPQAIYGTLRSRLLMLNGTAWFTATDGVHGAGLWKSNGTAAGTVPVRDRFQGIENMTQSRGRILFFTRDTTHGITLWQTNAASTNATIVKAFGRYAFTVGIGKQSMLDVNGTVYFSILTYNGMGGLWKTDGTTAGTVKVSNVIPNDSLENSIVAMNGRIYFASYGTSENQGLELWTSDGTAAGTRLVKDILPGAGGSDLAGLTVMGNALYFSASDGTHGHELWKSNGTAAGTVMVKDIWAGGGRAYPKNLTAVGSTLYFSADDGVHGPELWKSNGTAAGTVLVKDITPGAGASNPSNMANVYGTLYFNAYSPTFGNELWKSDGTAAGTTLVSDAICAGVKGSNPTRLTLVGSFLYFEAANYNTTQGRELWAVRVR